MHEIVHIHRSTDWFDSEHAPIARQDWDAFVEGQRDLRRDADEDDVVRWLGHPLGLEIVLTWADGRVTVFDVDEPTMARLDTIARDLQAVLQDGDCEILGGDPKLAADLNAVAAIRSIPYPEEESEPRFSGPTSRADFLRSLLRRP